MPKSTGASAATAVPPPGAGPPKTDVAIAGTRRQPAADRVVAIGQGRRNLIRILLSYERGRWDRLASTSKMRVLALLRTGGDVGRRCRRIAAPSSTERACRAHLNDDFGDLFASDSIL